MRVVRTIPSGALTALVTPFFKDGKIDEVSFAELIRFQICQGISGIVPAGTTGESPTLDRQEHELINMRAIIISDAKCFVLAGCGSNCTREAMHYVNEARNQCCRAVLLVDPYYNGPSSLEIREEYYGPIAEAFPSMTIVPYIIPGRTGCKLLPEDLAILHQKYPNICAVKEATGDVKNVEEIRRLLPEGFQIFSGDDDKTFSMMTNEAIKASGVVSVISNIAPAVVQKMCVALIQGKIDEAKILRDKLDPLFKLVTVMGTRTEFLGSFVLDKFRNPLPIKTAMNGLGMPSGVCRQPLGKMSENGVSIVRKALKEVWNQSPEILKPIGKHFDINIGKRLSCDRFWDKLSY